MHELQSMCMCEKTRGNNCCNYQEYKQHTEHHRWSIQLEMMGKWHIVSNPVFSNLIHKFISISKMMYFASWSPLIHLCMLYYDNEDTSEITTYVYMYIPWYNIQTIKLRLPFIFQYCIAVIRKDTLRPACMVRNCMHKSFGDRNGLNSSINCQAV